LSPRARTAIALLALVGAFALGGCGGDDDSGSSTTAETPTQAENERLSQESWETYEAAASKARTVNNASIAVFRKCRNLTGTPDSQAVETCLGTSTSNVVTEGKKVLATLDGLEQEAGGACATATANLAGSIKLYVASVNAIGVAVDSGSVATSQAAIDNAVEGLGVARDARAPFEAACKPV
jgi:hypothetical protein